MLVAALGVAQLPQWLEAHLDLGIHLAEQTELLEVDQPRHVRVQRAVLEGRDRVVVRPDLTLAAGVQAAGRDARQLHQRDATHAGHVLLRLGLQLVQTAKGRRDVFKVLAVLVDDHQALVVPDRIEQVRPRQYAPRVAWPKQRTQVGAQHHD